MAAKLAVAALFCGMAGAQSYATPDLAAIRVGVMVSFDHSPQKNFPQQLRREVEEIFRPAGLNFVWELRDGNTQPGTYDRVVLLDFRGWCGSDRPNDAPVASTAHQRLGGAVVSDGEVTPFIQVDCDQMAAAVRNMRTQVASRLFLPGLYSRLASRVTAHELMHVLLRTTDHQSTDCMRPLLRASDLQSEARLTTSEIGALRLAGRAGPRPTLAQGARRGKLDP